MARRHVHEDHVNHEAWAIPYGDLVTLLLAFFVVMYAVSSVNAGKYRAAADSLNAAFGGAPRAVNPVQIGHSSTRSAAQGMLKGTPSPVRMPRLQVVAADSPEARAQRERTGRQLQSIGDRIGDALSGLVTQNLVHVRRGADYLEVEIQSDLLFPSGSAMPSRTAVDAVRRLGDVLRKEPNAVRVEGYTDNEPIHSPVFVSNWELSGARAASVVHVLVDSGVAPTRLSMAGFGEYQPVADNGTPEGRNANRRVMLVILAPPNGPDAVVRAMPVAASAATPSGRTG